MLLSGSSTRVRSKRSMASARRVAFVAALDEKRLEPGLGKGERRKEAGATRTHNHGAVREF